MTNDEIKTLADLSKLHINESELDSLRSDFDGILNYIDVIQAVDVEQKTHYTTNLTKNMMREDDDVYEAGEFSEAILENAPHREGDSFKVKKVL